MRTFLALLLLACGVSAADARGADIPSRRVVAAEMLRVMHCDDPGGYIHCPPPPSRIVANIIDCHPAPSADTPEEYPGRVFCRFSGEFWWPQRRSFGPVCTFLYRSTEDHRWLMSYYPTGARCADPEL